MHVGCNESVYQLVRLHCEVKNEMAGLAVNEFGRKPRLVSVNKVYFSNTPGSAGIAGFPVFKKSLIRLLTSIPKSPRTSLTQP